MDDRLDSGLLLVSGKMQEEPVHAALCFLMIAEIEVIKELLDLQPSICHRLRARLFRRAGGLQPDEGLPDLPAKLAHRIVNLLALQMRHVVVELGGQRK